MIRFNNSIKLIIFILFILTACTGDKDLLSLFENEKKIKSEIIELSDNDIIAKPFLLTFLDSFITLSDVYGDKLFTAIDLSKKNAFRFGKIGHGPGEFLIGTFCSRYNSTRDLYLFNSPAKKLYKTSIDSFIRNPDYNPRKHLTFNAPEIVKLNMFSDSLFIAQGRFGEYRLALYNNKGEILNAILKYPQYKESNNQYYYSLVYQGKLSIKPDDLKFVHITYKSSNIGFYEIKDEKIHVIKEIFLQNPIMQLTPVGNMYACIPDKDCIYGYLDVYTTKKFIYALYSDDKVNDNEASSSNILVFDWNGQPIKILKLDNKVTFICASDNDSFIYAISHNDEKIFILSYKL